MFNILLHNAFGIGLPGLTPHDDHGLSTLSFYWPFDTLPLIQKIIKMKLNDLYRMSGFKWK
jgi:hypothetical protein